MPVIIQCVKCQRKLRVLDRLVGKLVKCPACQVKFVAQAHGVAVNPAAGPAPGRAAAPRSQPPSRAPAPAVRTPPPSKAPLSHPGVPAAGRARAVQANSPPQEIAVDHGEEDFMPASAALMPRRGPQFDEVERNASLAGKKAARRPRQSPFLTVFATLGGVLLLTAILGMVTAWWVNSSVQSLKGRPMPGKVR